ncbi:GNAT family N-acetyltransferase [Aquipuribacter sp. SD81]|uniref:GNAT family N-acetyltransferase n=1 Tax=Aquipuribacter sp. SD81 TaxID=3127703 RepID=UPI0030187AD2
MVTDGRVARDATEVDAAACAAVYAPYVRDTAVSFELEPPDAAEIARRMAVAQAAHAWLVLDDPGRGVVGYAYGGAWKVREAYAWTCEVSVYVAAGRTGGGAGRALYAALLPRLAGLGYRRAVAGSTLPNPASEGLHLACGFEQVGVFRRVGWKLGRWHDVAWFQRDLDAPRPPQENSAL